MNFATVLYFIGIMDDAASCHYPARQSREDFGFFDKKIGDKMMLTG